MADNIDDEKIDSEKSKIEISIDNFLHNILDTEEYMMTQSSQMIDNYNKLAELYKNEAEMLHQSLCKNELGKERPVLISNMLNLMQKIERHNKSNPLQIIERSLFIHLFSIYDRLVGDILTYFYTKNPELYNGFTNHQFSFSNVLECSSIDELRTVILNKDIEDLKRESYIKQFEELTKRFNIKLTKFEEWPAFIECAQRRNLFTHCDGVVNKQYLSVCKSVNYQFKHVPKVGDKLLIGRKYFMQSCSIVLQVGIMLAHTLRYKLCKEHESADHYLTGIIFNFLCEEHWDKAISLSKFALSNPELSIDANDRLYRVNYAIALNAIGESKQAKDILSVKDWSASCYDFKLAHAVLFNDFSEAKKIMLKLGESGEYIREVSYLRWPLFRDFRNSDEFREAYRCVYGYEYSEKLCMVAEEQEVKTDETIINCSGALVVN